MALALDSSVTTSVNSNQTIAYTSTFSPPANSVVFVLVGLAAAVRCQVNSVFNSGHSLHWNLLRRDNAMLKGTAEVWYAVNDIAQTGMYVGLSLSDATANFSGLGGSEAGLIRVLVFTGADGVQIGNTAIHSSTTTGTPSLSLTTRAAHSWVWGVVNNTTNATTPVAGTGQAIDSTVSNSAASAEWWTQNESAITTSAGTAVAVNVTAPTTIQYDMVAFEVLETGAIPAYESAVLLEAPVGYWRLNETSGTAAADLSSYTHPGVYTTHAVVGAAGPIAGDPTSKAVDLTSTTWPASVTIADAFELDISFSFTVELWVKSASSTPGTNKFLLDHSSADGKSGYAIHTGSDGGLHVRVGHSGASFMDSPTPTGWAWDTNWHYIRYSFYANPTLYVDGSVVWTDPTAGFNRVDGTSGFPLVIGDSSGGTDNTHRFYGYFAEVALNNVDTWDAPVWSRWLTLYPPRCVISVSPLPASDDHDLRFVGQLSGIPAIGAEYMVQYQGTGSDHGTPGDGQHGIGVYDSTQSAMTWGGAFYTAGSWTYNASARTVDFDVTPKGCAGDPSCSAGWWWAGGDTITGVTGYLTAFAYGGGMGWTSFAGAVTAPPPGNTLTSTVSVTAQISASARITSAVSMGVHPVCQLTSPVLAATTDRDLHFQGTLSGLLPGTDAVVVELQGVTGVPDVTVLRTSSAPTAVGYRPGSVWSYNSTAGTASFDLTVPADSIVWSSASGELLRVTGNLFVNNTTDSHVLDGWGVGWREYANSVNDQGSQCHMGSRVLVLARRPATGPAVIPAIGFIPIGSGIYTPVPIHSLVLIGNSGPIISGGLHTVLTYSANSGGSWTPVSTPLDGGSVVADGGASIAPVIWASGLNLWVAGCAGPSATLTGGTGNLSTITSPDGLTWTARAMPWDVGYGRIESLAWNGSILVAGGQRGTAAQSIATSTDGITWTARSSPYDSTSGTANVTGIAWNGSLFVAVGYKQTGVPGCHVATSPDGITWTDRPTPMGSPSSYPQLNCVCWSASLGRWFAGASWMIGGSGVTYVGPYPPLMSSPDGITWTLLTCPLGSAISAIAANSAIVVAGGWAGAGAGPQIMTSTNGTTWTTRSTAFDNGFVNNIVYDGERFIAGGSDTSGNNWVLFSADGITWHSLMGSSVPWPSTSLAPEALGVRP